MAVESHRKETQGQIKRLEKIFKSLGQKPEAEACPGTEGLMNRKSWTKKPSPCHHVVE